MKQLWICVLLVLAGTQLCLCEVDEDGYQTYKKELEAKLYKAQKAKDQLQIHTITEQLKAIESIKTQPQMPPTKEEIQEEIKEEPKPKQGNLGKDLKAKMRDFFRRGKGKAKEEL